MGFLYSTCKEAVGLSLCSAEVGKFTIDATYEVTTCLKSQSDCIRNRKVCQGRCSGDGDGQLTQDFATFAAKQELSVESIGQESLDRGRANCTVSNRVIEVPLFYTGTQFELFSARLRVRGGFTAIDPRACARDPVACAAVQRVLEKEPTLTFDVATGRFRW